MLELTKLFGITVEQLMSGEIPEARLEQESDSGNIFNGLDRFVRDVADGIGSFFGQNSAAGVCDCEEPETDVFEESEQSVSGKESQSDDEHAEVDIQELLQTAPFMSKQAVEEMLGKCSRKLTISEISRFAPYVGSACLEKLIRESESEITWDKLKYIAPFLKKEAVDAFARMAAHGERFIQPAAKTVNHAAEEVYKNIEHVGRKIGKGVEQAARGVVDMGKNVVHEVEKVFDSSGAESREERLAKLRRQAFERALNDERWDWIETHISEISDDDFLHEIAAKAKEKNMQDWVSRNLGGYADDDMILSAINEDNWEWLGEHVWKFTPEAQEKIVRSAAEKANWQWISEHASLIDMRDCVADIADAARRGGEKTLAAQLAREAMLTAQTEKIASDALAENDYEFYSMIVDSLSQDAQASNCATLIQTENWEQVRSFSANLDSLRIEKLMETAIECGNFDAIDMIDEMLRTEDGEVEEC